MNNSKKITQGAMFLALVGAFMAVNRYFMGFYFDEFTFLLQALVLIIYGVSFGRKEAYALSFGLVVFTLFFGGALALIYCPLALLIGNIYVAGALHGRDSKKLFLRTLLLMVIGEVGIVFLAQPIFGFSLQQQIAQVSEFISQLAQQAPVSGLSFRFDKDLLLIFFLTAIIFTGVMEAMLIHLSAIYFLRRLKIREITVIPLSQQSPPSWQAYLALSAVAAAFLLRDVRAGETVFIVLVTAGILGGIYLLIWGFIFLMIWGKLKFNRNIGVFVFLFMLVYFYFAVIILLLGFLYVAGPLRQYVVKMRSTL